jgi:hypothetical protein
MHIITAYKIYNIYIDVYIKPLYDIKVLEF